jgi:hypothetical protein
VPHSFGLLGYRGTHFDAARRSVLAGLERSALPYVSDGSEFQIGLASSGSDTLPPSPRLL